MLVGIELGAVGLIVDLEGEAVELVGVRDGDKLGVDVSAVVPRVGLEVDLVGLTVGPSEALPSTEGFGVGHPNGILPVGFGVGDKDGGSVEDVKSTIFTVSEKE